MTLTETITQWAHEQHCQKAVKSLVRNGFTAVYCEGAVQAREYLLREAEAAITIGFGGSRTLADLEVEEALRLAGKEILNHGLPHLAPGEKLAVMRRQLTCDLFLTSTNALTLEGHLVNIDGNGNRAGAMFFGPRKVLIVVGRNKLVDGDAQAALHRIATWAAPANAKRLNRRTPCAETGLCSDCSSPERICRVTTILTRKPSYTDVHVLVVNEEMGF
ncbi:MAG: hypothetical protein H6Q00_1361 [Holophagaceae bacterium]|nr:hypothetical protein [Holophagaceae bacterium]